MINIGAKLRLYTSVVWDIYLLRLADEIWNFFNYLAHETQENENARETFSHPIPYPFMMHAALLDESHFAYISYEHSHTPCVPI